MMMMMMMVWCENPCGGEFQLCKLATWYEEMLGQAVWRRTLASWHHSALSHWNNKNCELWSPSSWISNFHVSQQVFLHFHSHPAGQVTRNDGPIAQLFSTKGAKSKHIAPRRDDDGSIRMERTDDKRPGCQARLHRRWTKRDLGNSDLSAENQKARFWQVFWNLGRGGLDHSIPVPKRSCERDFIPTTPVGTALYTATVWGSQLDNDSHMYWRT